MVSIQRIASSTQAECAETIAVRDFVPEHNDVVHRSMLQSIGQPSNRYQSPKSVKICSILVKCQTGLTNSWSASAFSCAADSSLPVFVWVISSQLNVHSAGSLYPLAALQWLVLSMHSRLALAISDFFKDSLLFLTYFAVAVWVSSACARIEIFIAFLKCVCASTNRC
jgi:hypothetical protein